MSTNNQEDFSTELLRVYYGRLFPYDRMFTWLSYDSAPANETCFFPRRELSFTIEDDIYIRYQSFADKAEFTAAIQKRQPFKIDIGAVFTSEPATRASVRPEAFKPAERELVFDVDMTDYDGIRTCCTGANICPRCWPYMTMALTIVHRALKDDFNFKHILWVYSGRRGIHCWVCDKEARTLPNEARDAIVRYLSVDLTTKNEDKGNSVFKQPMHPMIKRSYKELEPLFELYIVSDEGQALLGDLSKCTRLLNTLPDESIRERLYDQWKPVFKTMTGLQRWKDLLLALSPTNPDNNSKRRKINFPELEAWKYELVLTHCYPRLDVNVSKAQNHLLKSPFCIHPKTGRVCVPIDPAKASEFNPFEVPTLGQLCAQIDRFDHNPMNTDSGAPDVDKTEMKLAVECFDRSFLNELVSSLRKERKDKAQQIAAVNMDF